MVSSLGTNQLSWSELLVWVLQVSICLWFKNTENCLLLLDIQTKNWKFVTNNTIKNSWICTENQYYTKNTSLVNAGEVTNWYKNIFSDFEISISGDLLGTSLSKWTKSGANGFLTSGWLRYISYNKNKMVILWFWSGNKSGCWNNINYNNNNSKQFKYLSLSLEKC